MGVLKDILGMAKDFAAFIIGDKKPAVLEPPLGELETEKRKQALADKRRERANRKHGGGS